MGITNPVSTSHRNFEASTRLTSPLVATIATQDQDRLVDISEVLEAKASIRRSNREYQAQQAESVRGLLSPQLNRLVELAMEKGASSWLSVLPLDDHNFSLHKGAFKDAICLRYDWKLPNTPIKCTCGTALSIDHAIICPKGGFPTIRHNELRDVTASLLLCHNVATEPRLPVSANISLALAACSVFTTRWVLEALGLYPYQAPCACRLSHHFLRSSQVPAPVASSAYHTCLTPGAADFNSPISGFTASAYMAMANGSPCVVPSEDVISPSPQMMHLTGALYVFTRI